MGFGLPAAIGAAVANPEKTVVIESSENVFPMVPPGKGISEMLGGEKYE